MDGVTRRLQFGLVIALVLAVVAFVLPSLCDGAERGEETKAADKPESDARDRDHAEGTRDRDGAKDEPRGDLWFDLRGVEGQALKAELEKIFKRIDELEKRMDELMGRPRRPDVDRGRMFDVRPPQRFHFERRDELPPHVQKLLEQLKKEWPRDVERWFDEGEGPGPFRFDVKVLPEVFTFRLSMDAQETDDATIYTLDAPGMAKDEIVVEIEDDVLTISGERKERVEEKDADGEQARREIVYGSFMRTITLPRNADTEKITSEYTDGVLTITVPKKEEQAEKSRRIIVHHP